MISFILFKSNLLYGVCVPKEPRNQGSRAKKIAKTAKQMRQAKDRKAAMSNRGSQELRRAKQVERSKVAVASLLAGIRQPRIIRNARSAAKIKSWASAHPQYSFPAELYTVGLDVAAPQAQA